MSLDEKLIQAAKDGNLILVKELLNKGADIHTPYNQRERPLFNAIQNGHYDVVKYLIDQGADIHSGFLEALRSGNLDIADLLIEEGINITDRDNFALRYAVANRFFEVIPYLARLGADISILHASDLAWVQLLLAADVDVHPSDNNALRYAVIKDHSDAVEKLLEAGADVHIDDDFPLRFAAGEGHERMVELLLEAGADVHAKNNEALRWANESGHERIVDLLLEAGADPSILSEKLQAELEGKEVYKQNLIKRKTKGKDIPRINYTQKSIDNIKHKTNTDLELLKRLKGYLNG